VLFKMIRRSLALAVALAVTVVLAGCSRDPGGPVPPGPVPTLRPTTTLTWTQPRMVRVVDGFSVFEVNAQQHERMGRRLAQVLHREGLWDQGVRFGANADPSRNWYVVLIKPGVSRLSPARSSTGYSASPEPRPRSAGGVGL
jgi:hypothetical protein